MSETFKSLILKKDAEIANRLSMELESNDEQLLEDYKAVFGTDAGMRVLAHMISLVPIFRPSADLKDAGGAEAIQRVCDYIGLADPFIYPEMMRRRAEMIADLREQEKAKNKLEAGEK